MEEAIGMVLIKKEEVIKNNQLKSVLYIIVENLQHIDQIHAPPFSVHLRDTNVKTPFLLVFLPFRSGWAFEVRWF